MSKVIDHETIWYQELAPRDYYNENELERAVKLNIQTMFPEFKAFSFKQKLTHAGNGNKSAADLGMVKNDYSEWYVIEVELGKHSKDEVLEQIETFRNFTPTKAHSDYIHKERKELNKQKLEDLVTSKSPKLMVIVNEDKQDWKKDLKKLDCQMCVFQIYNDFDNRKLYRLQGEFPNVYTDFCNCRYEKLIPYTVKVLNRDFLNTYNINSGDEIDIVFEGKSYKWIRRDSGSEIFLECSSRTNPLDPISTRYRLNFYSSNRITKKGNFFFRLLNRSQSINQNTFVFEKD